MAEKETSNRKLQEQSMKTVLQSQLAKIKKEEEEELWISGEELYTEGSSDEEEYKIQSRSRRKVNNNISSRTSSINSSVERRGHSPVSIETKSKLNYSADALKGDIIENQFVLKTVLQCDETLKDSSRTSSMESPRSDHLLTTELSTSSITNDFSDLSTVEDQIENTEISWKANKESFENDWFADINISNIDAEDERIRKEILEVKILDNIINTMNDKVKKTIEETVLYQFENRKRLEKMLKLNPSETGKLAENTRQFLYLCPKYTTLNTESDVSLETNNFKEVFQNRDNINLPNLDNKDKWKFTDTTYCVKNINNVLQDSTDNPYIVNAEMKEMLEINEEMTIT
ncbi:hypothetical protein QLX08_007357 [Tetragonisca angustula]|uniref:Fibrous sheath-interacting protein 1 n=1 Tax=Tetragonisca angustula TaxID=166442 RepID=A0AAW0ZQR6_9HYME